MSERAPRPGVMEGGAQVVNSRWCGCFWLGWCVLGFDCRQLGLGLNGVAVALGSLLLGLRSAYWLHLPSSIVVREQSVLLHTGISGGFFYLLCAWCAGRWFLCCVHLRTFTAVMGIPISALEQCFLHYEHFYEQLYARKTPEVRVPGAFSLAPSVYHQSVVLG